MKYLVILLCLTLIHTVVGDQKLTPAEERMKEATDKCLTRVSNGQADDAFSGLLKEFWKDRATVGQATMAIQRQYRAVLGRAEETIGKPVPGGYEFVGLKRLGSSAVKLIYLQKNEQSFLPWAFSFYRANQDWRLTHISFPDVGSDDIRDFTLIIFAEDPKSNLAP